MNLSVPSRSGALWEMALECALRREDGTCRNEYSSGCDCKYNPALYGNFSEHDLRLFMYKAEGEACLDHLKSRDRTIFAVAVILFLFIVIFSWYKKNEWAFKDDTGRKQGNSLNATPKATRQNSSYAQRDPAYEYIPKALTSVATRYKQEVDVNRDGLTNCIDAAVLFYRYYPDKNKVCIEVNYNPNTGWHHLFNCVLIDGNWVAIEPQAGLHKGRSYLVREFWKHEYDRQYNRDVTSEYLKYVRK